MNLKTRSVVACLTGLALLAFAAWGLLRPQVSGGGSAVELSYLRTNANGFKEYLNPKDGSEMVLIPAGRFLMGSETLDETRPQQQVDLGPFCLGKHEVTNAQFQRFLEQTGHQLLASRWDLHYEQGLEDYPVVYVSWFDAAAYCEWAGGRLPTEAEWEKAARGPTGLPYPWGQDWDKNRCNNLDMEDPKQLEKMAEMDVGRGTTPVGSFPSGASPYGVLDLLGNAVEWCSSVYQDYPYRAQDGREAPDPRALRVLRGGCWYNQEETLSGFYRDKSTPEYWYFYNYVGFRVAMPAPDETTP
jgi:formylglycine-generating enzyme required for sulfatase activity